MILIFSTILIIQLRGQSPEELEVIEYHQKVYNGLLDKKATPNYLYPISKSDSLLQKCMGTPFESLAYQSLSWYYSYVGEYQKALELYSKTLSSQDLNTTSLQDVTRYKPKGAVSEIGGISRDYDYVLINEAHHKPQHRIFTLSLLEELKKYGYTILAVEGLGLADTIINSIKVPDEDIGGLVLEPNYANLLREALRLGYEILPYDYNTDFSFSKRDSLGALRILEGNKRKSGKALIHCGYEHVDENQESLAYWLSKFTQKEVFTINQTLYSEEVEEKFESPYFQMATDRHTLKRPFVLKKRGGYFKEKINSDLYVFHPPTEYAFGRPTWLVEYDLPVQRYLVELSEELFEGIKELSLVQVFIKKEYNRGIPIDQYLIEPGKPKAKAMFIPNGEYVLRVENINREILLEANVKYDELKGAEIDRRKINNR